MAGCRISGFSIDFQRRSYSTLTLPCQRVILTYFNAFLRLGKYAYFNVFCNGYERTEQLWYALCPFSRMTNSAKHIVCLGPHPYIFCTGNVENAALCWMLRFSGLLQGKVQCTREILLLSDRGYNGVHPQEIKGLSDRPQILQLSGLKHGWSYIVNVTKRWKFQSEILTI